MTLLGWIALVVGSLIVGAVAQWLMAADELPYRWALSSIATFVAGAASSEILFQGGTPEWEGVALWPAVIGGLLVGVIVDMLARYLGRRAPGSKGHGAAVR